MLTKDGPKVLEYNVRFGDPETQSVLSLLDSDLAEIMVACAHGSLESVTAAFTSRFAATVVVAAGGYPGSYKKGLAMQLDATPDGMTCILIVDSVSLTPASRGRPIPRRNNVGRRSTQDLWRTGYCVHRNR